jgi:hypothetical protein
MPGSARGPGMSVQSNSLLPGETPRPAATATVARMCAPARIPAAAAMAGGICIVVDVPCFTTAVEASVTCGVTTHPFRWRGARTAEFAKSVHAVLAQRGRPSGPSLSLGEHGTLSR